MKKAILAWCFQYAAAIGVMFLLAAIWHALVVLRGIEPIILPTPLRVLEAAIRERETLFKGFLATGMAASLGLTLSIALGSLIAIVFSQSKTLRSAFYPYVLFLQTVPIVAIAPLLITWCGYGAHTVVLVAAIISIFPIVSNVTAGLISVDENLLRSRNGHDHLAEPLSHRCVDRCGIRQHTTRSCHVGCGESRNPSITPALDRWPEL